MKTSLNILLFFCLGLTLSFTAVAQEKLPKALTFQTWKNQQILDAQNQVLRASVHLKQLKNGKSHATETADLPASGRLKKVGEAETLAAAEQDLKRAQDNLTDANQLKFDNYVEAYVSTLRDQPEVLEKLSEKLSKEELAEILRLLMRKGSGATSAVDAARNELLIGGLVSGRHANTH